MDKLTAVFLKKTDSQTILQTDKTFLNILWEKLSLNGRAIAIALNDRLEEAHRN